MRLETRDAPWRTIIALPIFIWILSALGCADLEAYRTSGALEGACTPVSPTAWTKDKKISPGTLSNDAPTDCPKRLIEKVPGVYTLYFFEYDDQGFLFKDTEKLAQANLAHLYQEITSPESADKQYSIVTFIHGWKHTARSNDPNVQGFRFFLQQLQHYEHSIVENTGKKEREVIGIYVGWRGAGTKFVDMQPLGDYVEDFTFWTRKSAAGRVAQGDIHTLLATIQRMEDHRNEIWIRSKEEEAKHAHSESAAATSFVAPSEANKQTTFARAVATVKQSASTKNASDLVASGAPKVDLWSAKPVRNIVVGHSFGGLIAYTTLQDSLIRKLMLMHDVAIRNSEEKASNADAQTLAISDADLRMLKGDLVLLINPAIEATRFHPIFSLAQSQYFPTYQTPIFVSVTSRADLATRYAFPFGRLPSMLTKHYLNDEGLQDRTTFGHYDNYTTHVLATGDTVHLPGGQESRFCAAWTAKVQELGVNRGYVATNEEVANILDWVTGDDGKIIDADQPQKATSGNDAGTFPREFCSGKSYFDTPRKKPITTEQPGLYLFPATVLTSAGTKEKTSSMNSPIWNIATDKPIVNDHGDIDNERLWLFLRQIYEEGTVSIVDH